MKNKLIEFMKFLKANDISIGFETEHTPIVSTDYFYIMIGDERYKIESYELSHSDIKEYIKNNKFLEQ